MKVVVIDTSVLIGALIGKRGAGRAVLRQCLEKQCKPIISNTLFQEYEDVSSRPRIQTLSPLSESEIADLLHAFYTTCHWVPIYYLWRPNLRDEDDNFLIELAVAGNAEAIITNNTKDLKSAELIFENIQILTPAQFLKDDN